MIVFNSDLSFLHHTVFTLLGRWVLYMLYNFLTCPMVERCGVLNTALGIWKIEL